jgi:hypothetical protein
MAVASEDAAKQMCFNWKEHSQEIYSHIFSSLLGTTD